MDKSEMKLHFQTHGVKPNLHNVHETLLLPLWCRAAATELNSTAFKDFMAIQMIRRIDYDFSRFRMKIRKFFIVMLAARAKEQDEIINRFLSEHPRATIVNIGAGLDTTFYRVNNGTIKWYDLDVSDVIALRKVLLQPSPQIHYIAKSMFDHGFLQEITPPEDGILFLVSGVLMYFTETEIRSLLESITAGFPGCEIAFDALTPLGVSVANRMIHKAGISNAVIQWGIPNVKIMEYWNAGIRVKKQLPVCCSISSCRQFGVLSTAFIHLNRILHVYSLNRMQCTGA